MQLLGRVLMGENLRDALWALELLSRHDSVDPSRIGCVGLSYGGRMTMLAAALSPKIRVAVCSGALNVMQERILGRYSCGAQVIPGLLNFGDVPEIASLIAPRPCLWEVGKRDALMVKEWIEPALERMRRAWKAFGRLDQLSVDYHDGGHQWHGDVAYPLLERVLNA
jgi:dienelactone hydrolase